MNGLYKGIKVKVEKADSLHYHIEPDESMFAQNNIPVLLHNAGFVEYQMHWYKTVSVSDADLVLL